VALHAENGAVVGLKALRVALDATSAYMEAFRNPINDLVMATIHRHHVVAGQLAKAAAGLDSNRVTQIPILVAWHVLRQGAFECNRHQLLPTTYAEHRLARLPYAVEHIDFKSISFLVRLARFRNRFLAVLGGLNIRAAGEEQPVDFRACARDEFHNVRTRRLQSRPVTVLQSAGTARHSNSRLHVRKSTVWLSFRMPPVEAPQCQRGWALSFDGLLIG